DTCPDSNRTHAGACARHSRPEGLPPPSRDGRSARAALRLRRKMPYLPLPQVPAARDCRRQHGSWRDRDTERHPMASTESGSGRTANPSGQTETKTPNPSGNGLPYKRIATEEAFATPELLNLYRKLLAEGIDDPGFNSLWGFYLNSPSERPRSIIEKLQWLDERRVRDMDASGLDMHILSLTGPGVQIFDEPTAVALSKSSNDQLSEAIRKHPTRFAGIAAIAPQNP